MVLVVDRSGRADPPSRGVQRAVPCDVPAPGAGVVLVDLHPPPLQRSHQRVVPDPVDVRDLVGHRHAIVQEQERPALALARTVEAHPDAAQLARLLDPLRVGVQEVDAIHGAEARGRGAHADRPAIVEATAEKGRSVDVAPEGFAERPRRAAAAEAADVEHVDRGLGQEDVAASAIVLDLLEGEGHAPEPAGPREQPRHREGPGAPSVPGDGVVRRGSEKGALPEQGALGGIRPRVG